MVKTLNLLHVYQIDLFKVVAFVYENMYYKGLVWFVLRNSSSRQRISSGQIPSTELTFVIALDLEC